MTYEITEVTFDANECLRTRVIDRVESNSVAHRIAKRAAGRTIRFDAHYGPTACAYVGKNATVVIAF